MVRTWPLTRCSRAAFWNAGVEGGRLASDLSSEVVDERWRTISRSLPACWPKSLLAKTRLLRVVFMSCSEDCSMHQISLQDSTWLNYATNSSSFDQRSFDRISSNGTRARDQVPCQRRCVSLFRCTEGRVCGVHGGGVERDLFEPGVQTSGVPLCCGIRGQEVSGLRCCYFRYRAN